MLSSSWSLRSAQLRSKTPNKSLNFCFTISASSSRFVWTQGIFERCDATRWNPTNKSCYAFTSCPAIKIVQIEQLNLRVWTRVFSSAPGLWWANSIHWESFKPCCSTKWTYLNLIQIYFSGIRIGHFQIMLWQWPWTTSPTTRLCMKIIQFCIKPWPSSVLVLLLVVISQE